LKDFLGELAAAEYMYIINTSSKSKHTYTLGQATRRILQQQPHHHLPSVTSNKSCIFLAELGVSEPLYLGFVSWDFVGVV
jgi:hypothetical protein